MSVPAHSLFGSYQAKLTDDEAESFVDTTSQAGSASQCPIG